MFIAFFLLSLSLPLKNPMFLVREQNAHTPPMAEQI